jgi:ABC-type transport system involved in multi-copper enzyme maturation permease subunit
MNTTIALQMVGADFLKLRKKRGTLIWALVLAIAPLLIFFVVKALQHSSNPHKYGPAGGISGFTDTVRIAALFFGPLAAVLIGVEAGAGDSSAGVFRDLVVTGRSRLALFASRVPAALGMCWLVMLAAYVLLIAGAFIFASGLATPDASLIVNGLAFTLMSTGVVCVVAVGLASLTNSKAAAITALIGWQLVASPLIANITSLGSARKGILSQALAHFSPVRIGDRGGSVTMSEIVALVVVAIWMGLFMAFGAWRTRTMDA